MKVYDLVIENVTIVTMDANETIIENGIIGIVNGTISLIEKQTPENSHTQARERIDAT